jgi:hypothetical protein
LLFDSLFRRVTRQYALACHSCHAACDSSATDARRDHIPVITELFAAQQRGTRRDET